MDDQNVRNILGNVRNLSMRGRSPIEYIDGVLDSLPIAPAPRADLNAAAYGNGAVPTVKRPICGCCSDQMAATRAIFGGCTEMGADKALF